MARKKQPSRTVREAQLAYLTGPAPVRAFPVYGTSKLSAKNQLTLPVAYVRHLGLRPGDELNVWLEKDHVVIEKRLHGTELLDWVESGPKSPELDTEAKIDAWMRREREAWDRDWDEQSS